MSAVSNVDRHWLLTWTTYGTWLPGDERGFVGPVRDVDGAKRNRNEVGAPYRAGGEFIGRAAEIAMGGRPLYLSVEHASLVRDQVLETARHRGWTVRAVAVMANHVHVLVGVPGDPEPETLLRDLKSWASRALNERFEVPDGGRWWTRSGSKRKKVGAGVGQAVAYVRDQEHALAVWVEAGG